MSKVIENKITKRQYIFILISAVVGIGILSAPNSICQKAEQSGWISMFIGCLYPLTITYCAYLCYKNLGFIDFYTLNEKIYGKFFSKIISIFFMLTITIYSSSVLAGFYNVLSKEITIFLQPSIIVTIVSLTIVFTASFGLQSLGRLSEIVFYFSSLLFLFPLFTIKRGDITNILPIISSFEKILSSIPASFYSYAGIEISFFILPYVISKKNIKYAGFTSSIIIALIYTLLTFLTIYYLGFELTTKIYYPVLFIMETIEISIISDFKIIFIFLWSGIILKILACDYFVISYVFSKLTHIPYKKSCFITWPFVMMFTIFMIPEHGRNVFLENTLPYIVYTVLIYSITTAIISKLKVMKGV
ncbi:MAG: spore germination protein [Caloramator sp.]|nr:spore germination protein [Caloramator sp.]